MKKFTLPFIILLSLCITTNPVLAITNGMLASDVIGQYDGTSYTDPVGIFTKGGMNDGPNVFGFYNSYQTEMDTVNHRFFVAEYSNNRVLVYNLNEDNTFPDKFPDYVLGQPDFYTNTTSTTQSGMYRPIDIVYDSNNNRLFVAEWQNNRILVYDVNEITNGELAINVLGQPDFATNAENVADATSTRSPFALAYDDLNGMLFVA